MDNVEYLQVMNRAQGYHRHHEIMVDKLDIINAADAEERAIANAEDNGDDIRKRSWRCAYCHVEYHEHPTAEIQLEKQVLSHLKTSLVRFFLTLLHESMKLMSML